jgi:hypothetical protein
MPETYALLWSRQANCFHIEPITGTCESGMRFFQKNMENDYLLIFMGSADDVYAKATELRPIIDERDEVRRLYDDKPEWL